MVVCIKCHSPIRKLPVWLSRVSVGFVCDSCKTRPASQQSHARRAAPTSEPVDLDLDETVPVPPELADLAAELVDLADQDMEISEEPALAVVSMEETPLAEDAEAVPEVGPEPVEEAPKKRKATKSEARLPEVAIPEDAPDTLMAKKLLQVLAHEEPEEQPKAKKAAEKKPKTETAPEPKAGKAKAEATPEPKTMKAKAEAAPESKTKKAAEKKPKPEPEPKTKKGAETKAKPSAAATAKPKKPAAKKA